MDLVGKGGHIRAVPVPDWVRNELNQWLIASAMIGGNCSAESTRLGGHGERGSQKSGVAHREGIRQDRWRSQISAA